VQATVSISPLHQQQRRVAQPKRKEALAPDGYLYFTYVQFNNAAQPPGRGLQRTKTIDNAQETNR
jgi:hypothetical protein